METKESPRTSEEHRLPAWARVPSSLQREKIIREILAICGSGEIEVWKAKLTD
jgi:hypothetical protein